MLSAANIRKINKKYPPEYVKYIKDHSHFIYDNEILQTFSYQIVNHF